MDGHVKVYSGRKGRLPKHFVARQKLCLPASTSYWINALGGRPFLCLNKALDPTLTHALEADILPALERLGVLGPEAPDLTAPEAGEPALTLVFDREGLEPGAVPAPRPARGCGDHLAQELPGGSLAGGRLPARHHPHPRAGRQPQRQRPSRREARYSSNGGPKSARSAACWTMAARCRWSQPTSACPWSR